MSIVSQQAAYWLIRWTDDADNMPFEDRLEFVRWIKQSPEHVREFLHALRMDGRFARRKLAGQVDRVDSNVVHGDFGNGISQYDYQPCASVTDKVPRKRRPATTRTWGTRVAALAMMALLGFALANRTPEGVIETAAGQWQHMNAVDGSNIHMDARTALRVEMKTERRLVHLYEGQAVFDVASDPDRPFIVRTKLVDVMAVGTRFAVKIDESTGGVTTTVEEGIVEVSPRKGQGGAAVRLHPGEELHVPKASTVQVSALEKIQVDAKHKLQWTTGWYDVYDTTVRELVDEFNRRQVVQVRIDDEVLAGRSIDFGRIRIDSVDSFIGVMKSQRGVEVIREGTVITLKQRSE